MHQYLFPFYKYKLHDKKIIQFFIFFIHLIYIYTFILMCRNTASYLIFSSSDLLTDEDLRVLLLQNTTTRGQKVSKYII